MFHKRERKIKSKVFFWVLTLGFCVNNQRTIASLKRLYEIEANISICDSSWYDRFTLELSWLFAALRG
jgi:putative transposase